ncbi:UvrD-like helicase family protein [Larkinella arboricola]|uniref:UvrD-like helicase family protein n=1 Tax=Larkinella arboricola TaxID=643671 RepID=A0A327WJM4_LARAB|nr:ATP-binding domain-containing protein [Larkinella arboricola]RAJ90072.1 UvrD-like helicase family protein [Larkinella arboricola]
MFAHAVGMRLFESKKLNWFEDAYWNVIGYQLTHVPDSREVSLTRDPIRRFEDLELENLESVIIQENTHINNVLAILKLIQEKNKTVQAEDIAVIFLDDHSTIYGYIDRLALLITKNFGWEVNRAYETKAKIANSVYISNANNVKGLEFPFVLCLTDAILDSYRYRNILYTMLTRSFIQSYLLVQNDNHLQVFKAGLEEINKNRCIKTIEPTEDEKLEIKNTLLKIQEESTVSYKEFLEDIFLKLKIPKKCWKRFEQALVQAEVERFDKVKTEKFIKANKEFYCE